jgi:hypothetical protein
VRTAWAGYWDSYLLTFLCRQEVVVADYDRVRHEPFRRLVLDSPDPALIGGYVDPGLIGRTLATAGLRWTEGRGGTWTVFARITPRPDLGPLDRRALRATCRHCRGAFDAAQGGVSTVQPGGGDRVVLDLGARRQVNGVVSRRAPSRAGTSAISSWERARTGRPGRGRSWSKR